MSGTTWSKFFWADWQSDPALRLCSYAARGLWMDMLCIAASHDPVGYVCVAGQPLDSRAIARMTGGDESEVDALLVELDRNGVFSRDRRDRIFSRRMISDAKKAKLASENGKKGGNPSLGKDKGNPASDNPPLKGGDKAGVGQGDKPHKPEARKKDTVSNETDARASPGEVQIEACRTLPLAKGCWRLALSVLTSRGKMTEAKARTMIGRWKADGVTDQRLWDVAEAALEANTEDPVPYMAAAFARAPAASSLIENPSEERQRFWMKEWLAKPYQWRSYERGPPPGQPGCQVSPAIQAEFAGAPT